LSAKSSLFLAVNTYIAIAATWVHSYSKGHMQQYKNEYK